MIVKDRIFLLGSIATCFLIQAQGADKYTDGNRPYEFGFSIDGEQHRHEKKDERGLIMGEFGFITADGVYHVTVYATDEEGRFKIVSMKNIRVKPYPTYTGKQSNTSERQGHSLELPASPQTAASPTIPATSTTPKPVKRISIQPPVNSCSHCSVPTTSTPAPVAPPSNQPMTTPNQIGSGSGLKFPQEIKPQPASINSQLPVQGPSTLQNNFVGQQNNLIAPSVFSKQGGSTPQQENTAQKYPQQNLGPSQDYPRQPENGLTLEQDLVAPHQNPQDVTQLSSKPGQLFPIEVNIPAGPKIPQTSKSFPGTSLNKPFQPAGNTVFSEQPLQSEISQSQPAENTVFSKQPPQSQTPQSSPAGEIGSTLPNSAIVPQQVESGGVQSPDQRSQSLSGRTPKRLDGEPSFRPTGTQPNIIQNGSPNSAGFGGPLPKKPTLVSAQMQIVDKNTDIYHRGPGENEGLPEGLTKDDMTHLLYTFNYTVGFHGHFEEGYTNGAKQGYYYVTGRNGVRTRVDYVADAKGFRPKISQEVLDLLSDDVPKPETEKDEKYGLKGYEFKWLYYPVEAKGR